MASVVVTGQQIEQHVHALGRLQLHPEIMDVHIREAGEELGGLVLAASLGLIAVEHGDERLDRAAVEQAHAVVKVAAQREEQRNGL